MPADPTVTAPRAAADPDGAPTGVSRWDIVFLDRDGTINERVEGYVDDPDRLVLLPGAADAVARLNAASVRVVLVTNQRGLATGRLTEDQWAAVTERLVAELAAAGGHLDAIRMCPHESDSCDCRKPAPGMFLAELEAQPWARTERCAMVGDAPTDVAPARALGMSAWQLGVDAVDLADAVAQVLSSGVVTTR
jgi:D-glycero-D-manno-heptose 1,7-bisphosphate phosphatase